MTVIDSIAAWQIAEGDQVIIESDPVEVAETFDGEDPNQIIVRGYSHESGDRVEYSLYADDKFDLWTV
jgi:hypothetical protein